MISIAPEYLNARNAAQYLGISYGTLMSDYPSWIACGVTPIRYGGRANTGHLRFKKSELDHLMNQWKMIRTEN